MPIKTFGTMAVDWEERVHFDRLRVERLARIKTELKKSEIGALLCFDMNNIRYITNTTIGTWAIDKLGRFCLLPQDDEPINWDFGVGGETSRYVLFMAGRRTFTRQVSPHCAAQCLPAHVAPRMWRARSASNLRSADSTKSRSAWM